MYMVGETVLVTGVTASTISINNVSEDIRAVISVEQFIRDFKHDYTRSEMQ